MTPAKGRPDSDVAATSGTTDIISAQARRWMLLILILGTAMSSIDRQILPLLLEQIKRSFELSDTQLGILTGPSFFLLYALCALPLAIVSDRISRRLVIAWCLAAFSMMTALSGLAPGFLLLIILRMGIAIGEAGNVPASQAMVGDIYDRSQLTSAMSWLYFSQSIGTTCGFLLGGFLGQWLGWRLTFVIVGLPGVLLAFAAYFALPKNNASTLRGPASPLVANAVPLKISARFLWSQATYRYLTLANAIWAFASAGIAMWTAIFIGRIYKFPPAQIGMIMALVVGVIGALGLSVIGTLAQRLDKRDVRWPLWIVALSSLISAPLACLTFLSQTGALAWVGGCLLAFVSVSTQGSVASTVQMLVPPHMRSIAVAIKHVVVTAIGAGTAPLVVGILNDVLAASYGDQAVRYTLASLSVLFPVATVFFYIAARSLRTDIARAETWEKAANA
jgi:predicted MFS family arabinose efflux permease